MQRIWVTGEALIDFVPVETSEGTTFLPVCGGGTYNTAKAAARLGADVRFIGAISTDIFGAQLAKDLAAHRVDTTDTPRVPQPTTLAFLKIENGEPRYAFYNTGTATQLTDMTRLTCCPANGDILHAGSISLVDDPGARSITDYVLAQDPEVLVSFDPNVRTSMIEERDAWAARMKSLLARSDIIKLSDEDLESLAPGQSADAFADERLADGAAIVMVTRAERGAFAASRTARVVARAHTGSFTDTVGAGDTVMGAILSDITSLGLRTNAELAALDQSELSRMSNHAMAAAWLCCLSKGCVPPDPAACRALARKMSGEA